MYELTWIEGTEAAFCGPIRKNKATDLILK